MTKGPSRVSFSSPDSELISMTSFFLTRFRRTVRFWSARPEEILFTKTLPKTRSGKIMRRLLKDLASGKTVSGDTSTLENPGLVELLE